MSHQGDTDQPSADYELLDLPGEGGMGVVYAARQASIDRTVAVKMLKYRADSTEQQRHKFVNEAVVTRKLEHPNIVPIYDLGTNRQGALFYSMRRVRGTPWEKVLGDKSIRDNLDIWTGVANAVAFAHDRRVIHRDLKPENVMLGDFGEVIVMDWGLALTRDSVPHAGMGGTPAYMAPEMATGPVDRVGIHSDIYLLGGILYEIVTGQRPHLAADVMQCLTAAARNQIPPTDKSGELVDISLKAMATKPADRYASVGALKDAVRRYLAHEESVNLSTRAAEMLHRARQSDGHSQYSRAVHRFEDARDLWPENEVWLIAKNAQHCYGCDRVILG